MGRTYYWYEGGEELMNTESQARTASTLNVIAGIWLIVAPFVLSYTTNTPRTNDVWLGVIVGVLALIRLFTSLRTQWLSWINILAGLWLIIAPFTLRYVNTTARWNDIILGIIVAGLAIWSSGASSVSTGRHAHA